MFTKRLLGSSHDDTDAPALERIEAFRGAPVGESEIGGAWIAPYYRVGVQTFAERNKISFCRYRSRTGALNGTELLGNRCSQ